MTTANGNGGMKAKIESRKAAEALSRHVAGDAVIEADAEGPSLWQKARKFVIAGMVALATINGVAPAFANQVNIPQAAQAQTFLAQANEALTKSDSFLSKVFGGSSIDLDDDCVEVWTYVDDGRWVDPYQYLNLPANADFTNHNQIKGVIQCLGEAMEDRFEETSILGPNSRHVFKDVGAILAAAKYAPDATYFKSMLEIEASSAMTWLLNGNQKTRDRSLVKLVALDQVIRRFEEDPKGIQQLRDADVWHLPRIAMAIATHAERTVNKADYRPDAFYHTGRGVIERLEEAGLPEAARTVRRVADLGIYKNDVCDEVYLKKDAYKSKGNSHAYCPLRKDADPWRWEEEAQVTERFGNDALSYIDSILAKPAQTSSLKQ